MSIFKKPSELPSKVSLQMLIYGVPSCGKTTLACSAPNAVILDFEDGIHRVNYAFQVPSIVPTNWTDVVAAFKEIAETKEIESVIVDSVDRLLDFAMDYVIEMNPNEKVYAKGAKKDPDSPMWKPSLNAYGMRKQLYKDLVKTLRDSGKNIIYLSHTNEDKDKMNLTHEVQVKPNISDSNRCDITTDLDMEGMMFKQGNRMFITFDPWGDNECKNSCHLHGKFDSELQCFRPLEIPINEDAAGNAIGANDFLAKFFAWNQQRIIKEREVADAAKKGGANE